MRTHGHLKFVRRRAPVHLEVPSVVRQHGASMHYNGVVVREHFVAPIVGDVLGLIEDCPSTGQRRLALGVSTFGRMQCSNDLEATGLRLCPLLHFAKPHLEIRRVAHGR
jgi:hypothetical protein